MTKNSILITAFVIAFIALSASACAPISEAESILPTDTPMQPTMTNTPTIVWFPPTSTNTPIPIPGENATPTPDMRPSYGELLLHDDFSNPSDWLLPQTDAGIISIERNELAISVSSKKGYVYGVRKNTFVSNFYLEITANPSLCHGDDEYGILFRLTPTFDFYRFGFTCNGAARLDRILNGNATSPKPPMTTGLIPPGAPSISKMGIWAVGKEMHFYANDQFLFTVRDPSLLEGAIGLFARASGEDMVSINFSNLSIYQAP